MRIFLILFSISFFSVSIKAQPAGYIWPTDASPYLSSTFAETRSAHFHAGIDIKTWGREGYRVFASKAGVISRMAITSRGYGRVLYMKHDDGTYTVYAHLQRFIPTLQSYIDSVRLINHQFEIDLNVESEGWTFEQGEVIGYTGSTGIGPPHLHFEIRDQNERPINALRTNLEVEDTIPPRISAVLVIPMSDSTIIDGNKFPRVYYPTEDQNGVLKIDTVRAYGPIGIAISEYDRADNVTNRYASYEYRLNKEDETVFYSRHDEFDFEQAETMFLDRIAAHKANRRSYQTLFDDSKQDIPFYKDVVNQGILFPSDSSSSITVTVNDIYQNTTTVRFELLHSSFENDSAIYNNSEIRDWYWRNDWLAQHTSSSLDLIKKEFGVIWDSSKKQHLGYFNDEEILFQRITQNKPQTLISPDRNLKIHFTPGSFFDPLSVGIFTSEINEQPSVSVLPSTTPVRKNFFLEFFLNDNFEEDKNYQLFQYDYLQDRLNYVPSRLIGRTIHAQPDQLGEFVVIPDDEAPGINSVEIQKTNYGEWQVVLEVQDELSGIDFKSSEIMVNGVRGITEYDFEEEKLIYLHPDFVPTSENRIEVIITDNAGNSRFDTFYR